MPRSRHAFGFGRVNLLKKVRVGGEWKFCPAVVEAGRRLNDLVRVHGQIETHPEGTYYLDWREQGKRRRQPVRNRALVFEQARLKALELEAQRNRGETASTPANLRIPGDPAPKTPPQNPASAAFSSNLLPAAHLVWKGIEAYVQEMIGAAVRSQLASLGTIPRDAPATGEPRTTGKQRPLSIPIPMPKRRTSFHSAHRRRVPMAKFYLHKPSNRTSRTSSRHSESRKPTTNIA